MPTFEYGYDSPIPYDGAVWYDSAPYAVDNGSSIESFGIVANYKFFTTDLLTNQVLAEIPFKNVTYGRAIKAAGTFEGTINVIPDTASMDLYNSTLPGKCGLYVVRDDVCVWGGIIWGRRYDILTKAPNVNDLIKNQKPAHKIK